MKKLHFEIDINASPEKVWDAVVDDRKYREWTSAFQEGSYFEGGWEKGDSIRFMAENMDGGMVSEIAESRKYSFISIKHLGMIKEGKVDTTSEEVRKWVPAYENYTFKKSDGKTKFEVELDSDESYEEMFTTTWPEALKKLKGVAERG